MPVDEARQVAANDANLVRFQQVQGELIAANQKLAQDQASLGQSAQTTATAATQVAETTAQTVQETQQLGKNLNRGMSEVHTAIAQLPELANTQTNQIIQAFNALGAANQRNVDAVHAAISHLSNMVEQQARRIQSHWV